MRSAMLIIVVVLLLTGCNYHNDLKNLQLIYATAIDVNEKNDIVTTVTIQTPGGKERSTPVHEVLSDSGPTLQESLYKKIGLQIAGPIGVSKNQVLLIGEKLAKKDLADILDSTFRNSNDPMLAKVAIVRGKAGELIRLDRIGSATAGEYLRKIIMSARYETIIPSLSLHALYPLLHDKGRDPVIPLLRKEEDKAVVDGVGLIHKRKYTGYSLTPEQSTLLILMYGRKDKVCVITRKVEEDSMQKDDPSQYLSLNITNLKRDKRVWIDEEGRVQIQLDLKMKGSVVEFAHDNLSDKKQVAALSQRFSDILTEEGHATCRLLQKANSDALSIGRDIMAYYPDAWAKMDWDTAYPNANFHVSMNVEIISHGIIN
ncbi:Ger(x)C family spore germination protein [Paenibacillus roseipurpureus]|uniref:Ger(X)C family spore germination protein n=1 Tax=Paenibacillus roseopurpureus TaxID=2918901 RepID=A0AA96RJQ9_9BACL|nr:Ger(x)C family spore germination protein [Paenibacillus sp. MBLB1832]WNR44060.1 Ger(x)C family spore germination protein [Paenibacillus sp. MBLB1832]